MRPDRVSGISGEVDSPPPPATPSHDLRDLRHQQRRPQPGRQPAHPDAGRRLAGADRLHLPRRAPPGLRPVPGRLRDVASFIPYIGTAVYAILRPPEFLEDAHERELEIKAAELRVRQLEEQLLPQLRVPDRAAATCAAPTASAGSRTRARAAASRSIPRWSLCPYCETAHPLPASARTTKRAVERHRRQTPGRAHGAKKARRKSPRRRAEPAAGAGQGPPPKQRSQRSPDREPDPDPRQA